MQGRLAPSPSGHLHIGNASSLLLAWLDARSSGSALMMRMDDLDPQRSKMAFAEAALTDLSWMGLNWDREVLYQSASHDRYRSALQQLIDQDLVYACNCSRKAIQSAMQDVVRAPHGKPLAGYPGTCANKGLPLNGGHALRFRWSGDPFVLQRADGAWSYQLAVVVDDAHQAIRSVVRGMDLKESIPPQKALIEALGLEGPTYWHVPLWMGPDGHRLSKRHGDIAIRDFKARGWTPEALIGWISHGLGLNEQAKPLSAQELLSVFDHQRVKSQPVLHEEVLPLWA
ncbi:MAG: glutamate--tRNA ligase family protein [Schleiferiaceae bacterium]|mgnify:FL=1|nr:hypothetical protein [Flavobacteriales bacterium]MDG1006191.1 glutamate--tRNA ligase family protein [Schleiferiaceae bacterium]